MKNLCESCRNCFTDCSSDPVFVSEDEAAANNVPEDTVKECDVYVPEDSSEDEDYFEDDDDDDVLSDEDLLDDDEDLEDDNFEDDFDD